MRNKRAFCYIICGFLLLSCTSGKDSEKEGGVSTVLPDEIDQVRAMRLEYTDFYQELISNGTVSAKNKADLKFQSSDNVIAIYVKNGDRVRKGQAIAALDSFKLKNSMDQAKANLDKSYLDFQDALINQGKLLSDTAGIPPEVMRLAKIKSGYEQSLNQYNMAEYNLNNSVLYAPFDGVVANLFSKVYNPPNLSEPFCTIIDNERPEVMFKILESEITIVQIGNRVEISPFSMNDYICEGHVSEINPAVDKNGMVQIKATVNNSANRLYDGMNVKIYLQRSLGKQLIIPKEALVLRTNKKVVFTLKDNMARWVYVQTGFENSSGYVVTEGLSEGDSIIYEGNINLAHETPVRLKRNKD